MKKKDKVAAGVLAILLGYFGVHKFYLGCTTAGLIMLLLTIFGIFLVFPPLIISIIALVEGIIYLTKTDEEFEQLYVINKRCWF